jgi:hypothetical protein
METTITQIQNLYLNNQITLDEFLKARREIIESNKSIN